MTVVASRRGFLAGLGAILVAAPAIVRVASIMPVKQMVEVFDLDGLSSLLDARLDQFHGEHDQRLFRRYCGYDVVSFDAENYIWRDMNRLPQSIYRNG